MRCETCLFLCLETIDFTGIFYLLNFLNDGNIVLSERIQSLLKSKYRGQVRFLTNASVSPKY